MTPDSWFVNRAFSRGLRAGSDGIEKQNVKFLLCVGFLIKAGLSVGESGLLKCK